MTSLHGVVEGDLSYRCSKSNDSAPLDVKFHLPEVAVIQQLVRVPPYLVMVFLVKYGSTDDTYVCNVFNINGKQCWPKKRFNVGPKVLQVLCQMLRYILLPVVVCLRRSCSFISVLFPVCHDIVISATIVELCLMHLNSPAFLYPSQILDLRM